MYQIFLARAKSKTNAVAASKEGQRPRSILNSLPSCSIKEARWRTNSKQLRHQKMLSDMHYHKRTVIKAGSVITTQLVKCHTNPASISNNSRRHHQGFVNNNSSSVNWAPPLSKRSGSQSQSGSIL